MSARRHYVLFLNDMREAMERVFLYLDGVTFELLVEDRMVADAVCRNFEIIGEAAGKIPDQVQQKYPDLPWRQMKALRNQLSHAYFQVNLALIWKIYEDELDKNYQSILQILEEETAT